QESRRGRGPGLRRLGLYGVLQGSQKMSFFSHPRENSSRGPQSPQCARRSAQRGRRTESRRGRGPGLRRLGLYGGSQGSQKNEGGRSRLQTFRIAREGGTDTERVTGSRPRPEYAAMQ